MDFSTVERALSSLSRRQPALPDEVLNLSNDMFRMLQAESEEGNNLAKNDEYAHNIVRLIEFGNDKGSGANVSEGSTSVRWEPLAVGLRLIVDYLEKRTIELPQSAMAATWASVKTVMQNQLFGGSFKRRLLFHRQRDKSARALDKGVMS